MYGRFSLILTLTLLICAGIACAEAPQAAAEPTAGQSRYFELHVRPVLAQHCIRCHGPKQQKNGLRLDSRASLVKGGESGAAVVPGKPSESLLVEAIRHESFEMPPDSRLGDEAVAHLTHWVKIGAPWPEHSATITSSSGLSFTDTDRGHWAFQPVVRPSVPAVDDAGWSRNEIDQFVFRRMIEAGLEPSPEAEKLALMRRAYFDLTGLPPSPEEVDEFLADTSPQAYEHLVDRLLESPRYGEHWARHWLDLVRYAESDGYRQDAFRSEAYRYRDYVIRSLNSDKPYDQFVIEQLAGDEVAPGDRDALTATMYLRHWIYEFNQRDVEMQWQAILADVTDNVADVFLGMGMACARCHDHKFDPLPQRDYYRLQAFFAPLFPRSNQPLASLEVRHRHYEAKRTWEETTADIRRQLDAIETPILLKHTTGEGFEKFVPEIRAMIRKQHGERSPYEHQIAVMASRQFKTDRKNLDKHLKGEPREKWESLRAELAKFDHLKPKSLPTVKFAVSDVGPTAPVTFVPDDPQRKPIEPGYLSILDPRPAEIETLPAALETTGRRTALARWIASEDNPLSTRVIVNRIWQHHFGRGLVGSPSDFGRLGEEPSHPQLLDWLTREFVDGDWRMKRMHRLIMTSATYRQAAVVEPHPKALVVDPQNRLLSRMNVRRLRAEAIRDAALAVSGELDLKFGGPSTDTGGKRRTIYTKILRNRRSAMLDAFDAPDGFSAVAVRSVTTTPTQALLMINGGWMLERAKAFAGRVRKAGGNEPEKLVASAYQMALARSPSAEETAAAIEFLRQQSGKADSVKVEPQAVVDLCHVLLNSNEFLYTD